MKTSAVSHVYNIPRTNDYIGFCKTIFSCEQTIKFTNADIAEYHGDIKGDFEIDVVDRCRGVALRY